MPGVRTTLDGGARLLDLGCGTGHAVTVAARAFPASRFVGLDINGRLVAMAQAERTRLGLGNAAFMVADAAMLPPRPQNCIYACRPEAR